MKKIYFAGLLYDTNLGDITILKSTEALYKAALRDYDNISYEHLNLAFKKLGFISRVLRKVKRSYFRMVNLDTNKLEINILKSYYREQLDSPNLIVIVGGGVIKYKYQSFHLFLTALIELADEMSIPIVINAAGIEGYDEKDPRCQMLKKALNKDIVKSITTRDDVETLSLNYIDKDSKKHIGKVADPAVYCDEVYKQTKKPSNIYGIGLVRGGIFLDNDRNLSQEKIIKFYADLILEMESRELEYRLFTNGLPADSELIKHIEVKLKLRQLQVIEPKDDNELVEVIASFTTVIAARLHANIISYALNVPSIGLVWNDKLTLFGQDIGYPERFFEYDQLNASKIVDAAVLANEQGYEQEHWNEYKSTAKANIDIIIDKWLAKNYE